MKTSYHVNDELKIYYTETYTHVSVSSLRRLNHCGQYDTDYRQYAILDRDVVYKPCCQSDEYECEDSIEAYLWLGDALAEDRQDNLPSEWINNHVNDDDIFRLEQRKHSKK